MSFDLLRPSLFAAVLIALGGYIYVYRPLETTVADRYAQLDASRATHAYTFATGKPQWSNASCAP